MVTVPSATSRTNPEPQTDAGRALIEWASRAAPDQIDIWREHAALIEKEGVAILMHQRQCVGDDNRTPTAHALNDCPHKYLILEAAQTILDNEAMR